VKITIEHNFPEVAKALAELKEGVAGPALARAVNRTMEQAKTAMSREIRNEFAISRADVEQTLRITRASARSGSLNVEATLESKSRKGRSLNLMRFTARKTPRGLSFRIKKGGPRKVLANAFIANQGRTVFERVPGQKMASRSRYALNKHSEAIRAVQTIDVPQMFNTKRINAKVLELMETKFPEIFEREVAFYLDRFNRAGSR